MFEKNAFDEIPSLAVTPVTENGATFARPSEVREVSLAKTPDQPLPERSPGKPVSVLSAGIVVRGVITADEEIAIHGTVEGTIAHDMNKVFVGKEGKVRALIHANIVTVEGEVDGDIHGNELVELLAGAKVDGNIYCPTIKVDKGAKFNGTINMPE